MRLKVEVFMSDSCHSSRANLLDTIFRGGQGTLLRGAAGFYKLLFLWLKQLSRGVLSLE